MRGHPSCSYAGASLYPPDTSYWHGRTSTKHFFPFSFHGTLFTVHSFTCACASQRGSIPSTLSSLDTPHTILVLALYYVHSRVSLRNCPVRSSALQALSLCLCFVPVPAPPFIIVPFVLFINQKISLSLSLYFINRLELALPFPLHVKHTPPHPLSIIVM